VAAVLAAGCGDDSSDPDPGGPGGETEIDGGEAGTDGGARTSTTVAAESPGETTTGGATQGNQIAPGDTTQQTAQGNS
jgi:hypothetical protein